MLFQGDITACTSLTVSFWTSQADTTLDRERTLLDTSSLCAASSNGYYVKEIDGLAYEVGVCIEDRLWSVTFFLLRPDTAVLKPDKWHLMFAFDGSILRVYVDGIFVGSDTAGEERLWTDPELDMFQELSIGAPNHNAAGGQYPTLTISKVNLYENVVPWEAPLKGRDIKSYRSYRISRSSGTR